MAGELVFYWEAGQSSVIANVWREGSPWTHVCTDAAMDDTGHSGIYVGDCTSIKPGDHIIYTQSGVYLAGQIYGEQDSIHVWHVAKDGNDNNRGHNVNDAKLTIGAAVTAASSGDTIIIHPGTYNESVDCDTANKTIIFRGSGKEITIIQPSTTGDAFVAEHGCEFYNLSAIGGTGAGDSGIFAATKNNIVVDNCFVDSPTTSIGSSDGLICKGENLQSKNSHFRATYDGVNCSEAIGSFNNCTFEAVGGMNIVSRAVQCICSASEPARVTFQDCRFIAHRSNASSQNAVGLNCEAMPVLNNCVFEVTVSGSGTGDALGINCIGSNYDGRAVLENCSIYTTSVAGNAYDIRALNASDKVIVNNCDYDRTKVAGSGSVIDVSDASGRVDLTDDTITSSKYDQSTAHPITTAMQKAGSTIITGTVSYDNTAASTTVFYSDDITEATADHYNGRIVIFTSGALIGQATDITDYALVSGEGQFTVTALTEAPADNDTFVIV